jgi:ActR/RegA family two-component response regulator
MSQSNTPLLIVEDDLALQKQIKWSLDRFESVTASDRESALLQVRRHQPAVVTMDLGLPPDPDSVSEGFKLLEQILDVDPATKVIVLTGQNDQANALRAVAMGAYDFLAKPFEPDVLNLTIERAYRLAELQAENRRLQALHQPDALAGLITRDADMLRIARTIERVASSDATVLLLGESGTGKEVLAQGLHTASKRKGRFVAINCAAIPENLLESELFGYERGAFTGAAKTTPGKIETANDGTLMLDEIGDLPHSLQAKLLRFLQQRTIERLGRPKRDRGRCARGVRHAPGLEATHRRRPLPRRPVLPPGRDRGQHSTAACPHGRRRAVGACLLAPLLAGAAARVLELFRRRHQGHRTTPLAGQCARIAERTQARIHHGRDRPPELRRPRPAGARHGGAGRRAIGPRLAYGARRG